MHPTTNTQYVFNPETVNTSQVLLLPMTCKTINDISMKAINELFKLKIYRDRFDLAEILIGLTIKTVNTKCDPIKLISLMTWESEILPETDCKIVFAHFKSIEQLFQVSKEALEYSLKSLQISDKTRKGILTFLASDQDYFID